MTALEATEGVGASVSPEPLPAPKKRILAVDDSATYLENLGHALRHDGYDVVLARSREEALGVLAAQPVDCVVLDLLMPGGEETCQRIKAAPAMRDTSVIMVIAREDREAINRALAAGADDFFCKSSDLEVLEARVVVQLRRKQLEEARASSALALARAVLLEELERKDGELESFTLSVSHDLRAPLRGIAGFSELLRTHYRHVLDETGQDYLDRVTAAAVHLGTLIDALRKLARIGRGAPQRDDVDLSELATEIAASLRATAPERNVDFVIPEGMGVLGDAYLLRGLLQDLLGNAWKFTSRRDAARIELGVIQDGSAQPSYFVRDNGAGFDAAFAGKLFKPFQRLHPANEFAGTGIGLATVQRIVRHHGGRVWAEGAVEQGTTIRFTLSP